MQGSVLVVQLQLQYINKQSLVSVGCEHEDAGHD